MEFAVRSGHRDRGGGRHAKDGYDFAGHRLGGAPADVLVGVIQSAFQLLDGIERKAAEPGHLAQGKTHFELGELAPALAEYREAYRIQALPSTLFPIAECHRRLKQYREAITVYLESLQAHGEPLPVEDIVIKPLDVALTI